MRKAWKTVRAWLLRSLGQEAVTLNLGVKTQFRGRKNTLHQHEWQAIAEVFKRIPDLEDYLAMQVDAAQKALRAGSIEPDGDRRRLVLQAQIEVLQDMLNLPDTAAAKAQAMLRAKTVPNLKGNAHAYP